MSKNQFKNLKESLITQFNLNLKSNQFDSIIIDFKNLNVGVLKENK